jgi:hypothetical protein
MILTLFLPMLGLAFSCRCRNLHHFTTSLRPSRALLCVLALFSSHSPSPPFSRSPRHSHAPYARQPELQPLAITITFGNTHAPVAYNNLLKIYASLARELEKSPEAKERFPGVGQEGGKVVLALGADGPVGGEKAVAAYFVSSDERSEE